VSLWEGKLAILAYKEGYLVFDVNARPDVVVLMVSCPRHGMGRRGATVSAVSALLA
jgi:hypothetical protein